MAPSVVREPDSSVLTSVRDDAGGACRACGAPLSTTFVDLGISPLSNNFLPAGFDPAAEPRFPLHAFVCDRCLLVQIGAYATREAIFNDTYAYFSSYSPSWLAHARTYAAMAIERFGLGTKSRVVELASNDGYLLQHFAERDIPVLGIEPADNVARVARARGVDTRTDFFGESLGCELRDAGQHADLIVANNVLAHVPDVHDFVAGIAALLTRDGWATLEFPHVLELISRVEFDTIYHEHYSYFSLLAIEPVFARHGLAVVEAQALATHGGSLRLFVRHRGAGGEHQSVDDLRRRERGAGLHRLETYTAFPAAVAACRDAARSFFDAARRGGKRVAGYGAPAKGNTFLNYCGIGADDLPFTVDRNEHKVGMLLPGTHIPIRPVEALEAARPDYVFILPWNLRGEIEEQLTFVRARHAKFVTAVPSIEIRG